MTVCPYAPDAGTQLQDATAHHNYDIAWKEDKIRMDIDTNDMNPNIVQTQKNSNSKIGCLSRTPNSKIVTPTSPTSTTIEGDQKSSMFSSPANSNDNQVSSFESPTHTKSMPGHEREPTPHVPPTLPSHADTNASNASASSASNASNASNAHKEEPMLTGLPAWTAALVHPVCDLANQQKRRSLGEVVITDASTLEQLQMELTRFQCRPQIQRKMADMRKKRRFASCSSSGTRGGASANNPSTHDESLTHVQRVKYPKHENTAAAQVSKQQKENGLEQHDDSITCKDDNEKNKKKEEVHLPELSRSSVRRDDSNLLDNSAKVREKVRQGVPNEFNDEEEDDDKPLVVVSPSQRLRKARKRDAEISLASEQPLNNSSVEKAAASPLNSRYNPSLSLHPHASTSTMKHGDDPSIHQQPNEHATTTTTTSTTLKEGEAPPACVALSETCLDLLSPCKSIQETSSVSTRVGSSRASSCTSSKVSVRSSMVTPSSSCSGTPGTRKRHSSSGAQASGAAPGHHGAQASGAPPGHSSRNLCRRGTSVSTCSTTSVGTTSVHGNTNPPTQNAGSVRYCLILGLRRNEIVRMKDPWQEQCERIMCGFETAKMDRATGRRKRPINRWWWDPTSFHVPSLVAEYESFLHARGRESSFDLMCGGLRKVSERLGRERRYATPAAFARDFLAVIHDSIDFFLTPGVCARHGLSDAYVDELMFEARALLENITFLYDLVIWGKAGRHYSSNAGFTEYSSHHRPLYEDAGFQEPLSENLRQHCIRHFMDMESDEKTQDRVIDFLKSSQQHLKGQWDDDNVSLDIQSLPARVQWDLFTLVENEYAAMKKKNTTSCSTSSRPGEVSEAAAQAKYIKSSSLSASTTHHSDTMLGRGTLAHGSHVSNTHSHHGPAAIRPHPSQEAGIRATKTHSQQGAIHAQQHVEPHHQQQENRAPHRGQTLQHQPNQRQEVRHDASFVSEDNKRHPRNTNPNGIFIPQARQDVAVHRAAVGEVDNTTSAVNKNNDKREGGVSDAMHTQQSLAPQGHSSSGSFPRRQAVMTVSQQDDIGNPRPPAQQGPAPAPVENAKDEETLSLPPTPRNGFSMLDEAETILEMLDGKSLFSPSDTHDESGAALYPALTPATGAVTAAGLGGYETLAGTEPYDKTTHEGAIDMQSLYGSQYAYPWAASAASSYYSSWWPTGDAAASSAWMVPDLYSSAASTHQSHNLYETPSMSAAATSSSFPSYDAFGPVQHHGSSHAASPQASAFPTTRKCGSRRNGPDVFGLEY